MYLTAGRDDETEGVEIQQASEVTSNTVPPNIAVYNQKVDNPGTSLLKQLRHKLSILEKLLMPLLESDDSDQTSQVLIFHNYKVHSQVIMDHIRAKVRSGKKQLKAVYLNAEQTQQERMIAFEKMRVLKLRCVISTDLMSRAG